MNRSARPLTSDPDASGADAPPSLEVHRTDDFEVTGRGDHPAWADVTPVDLSCHEPLTDEEVRDYRTWFKTLWSPTGIYFLIHGGDRKLSADRKPDFDNLFTQDVFEVFLWPDTDINVYFEYNLSPYAAELAILVPHFGKHFFGWRPWQYEGKRLCRKATGIHGGPARPGADIDAWTGECFIPAALLNPLPNATPEPGVQWRANVYRIDYDQPGRGRHFRWAPGVEANFHRYHEFGTFRFVE